MLPAFKGPLISWKRTTLFLNYQLTWLRNDTDGAFAIPATRRSERRVGTGGERRAASREHRVQQSDRAQRARRPEPQREHGDAYTLLTGRDDNATASSTIRPRHRPQHAARDESGEP
jgi:hypothetical protein